MSGSGTVNRRSNRRTCAATASRALTQWMVPLTLRLAPSMPGRSEEHTSELQSRLHLVCRLLLEKKKKKYKDSTSHDEANEEYATTLAAASSSGAVPPFPAAQRQPASANT